jgi:hypothetical protein
MRAMRRPTLLGLALVAACSGSPTAEAPALSAAPPAPMEDVVPTKPPAEQWRVVNVMPAWWAYWEKAKGKPRPEQVALFEKVVVGRYPKIFAKNVVGRGDPSEAFDRKALIEGFLDQVEPHIPAMRKLTKSIEEELPAHRETFMEAFPDFEWDGDVYFTVSLDAFDGSVREVDGEPKLLFGVDKIARLYGSEAKLAPLFHHELFHILHLIQGKPFDPEKKNRMYQALWAEGLAVHVAHELNPTATNAQLVLSDAMVKQGDSQLKQLAQEMLDNIDSQDPAFYRDWFRSAGKREDIPNRVGYFLGFRVAQVMGKKYSLPELAALHDPELRAAIEAALRELAGT